MYSTKNDTIKFHDQSEELDTGVLGLGAGYSVAGIKTYQLLLYMKSLGRTSFEQVHE